MSDPKPLRAPIRIDSLPAILEQKLDNEPAILDVLLTALARGQGSEPLWEQLHEAAQRDDRLAELAFAYDRLSRDKKMRSLNPTAQATFLLHAGTFFADVFGDAEGGEGYLERALSLVPGHQAVFDKLEQLYTQRGAKPKLGELYAGAAASRSEPAEQIEMLSRAAALIDPADDERVIQIHQEILKLDPKNAAARAVLEERYERAGKLAALAKMLEDSLASGQEYGEEEALSQRNRLLSLYAGSLGELERALPHAEYVLQKDPGSAVARSILKEFVAHKTLAARAAGSLAAAYEATGEVQEAMAMFRVELEHQRGSRRVEAQKRLARLHHQLGELDKAYALDEATLPLDPGDDELRARYLAHSMSLGKLAEAARLLSRASTGSRDPAIRARIAVELGGLYVELGDLRKARMVYQSAVDGGADEGAALRSARALVGIGEQAKDTRLLAASLGRLMELEPDDDARADAALRLAQLAENELSDRKGAIAAYRRLIGTRYEPTALEKLEGLYESEGSWADLAAVLELRAAASPSREEAAQLAFRAADLRSSKLEDQASALAAWRAYTATYGASREAHARLLPLLEEERRWDELGLALEEEIKLLSPDERAPIFARLGQLRLARLADARGAIEAFRQALEVDSKDKASRLALDKMLASGDHRLEAAAVLEPIARAESAFPLLLSILDARASLEGEATARLGALREAAEIAYESLGEPKRAVEIAGRGVEIALEAALDEETPVWIELVERYSAGSSDVGRRAAVLRRALGERAVDRPTLALLARHTGEALAANGDVAGALEVFRRALAFDPSSSELIARVDALLREQGSPEERRALYRDALEREADRRRRRELLQAIGNIERRDLGDRAAAIATFRRALEEEPDDRVAFEALVELYEEAGEHRSLYDELAQARERKTGADRIFVVRKMAEVAASAGWLEHAATHYKELVALEPSLDGATLTAIEQVARARDDVDLIRTVLERRIAMAEPSEEPTWLEQLGTLEVTLGRTEEAAAAFRRAAELSEQAGDAKRAELLYERVLAALPDDRSAAKRLVALCGETGSWEKLPDAIAVLLRTAPSAEDAARVLLAFEAPAIRVGASDRFLSEARDLLTPPRGDALTPAMRAAIRLSRARVLAADPARRDEAAAAYRVLLEAGEGDVDAAAQAFEALLAGGGHVADRRWLYEWRFERAPEHERVRFLLAWAEAEEKELGDPGAAAALYERVIEIDPEHDDAIAARARILLAQGKVDEAIALYTERRDHAEGSAKAALNLEIARLLFEQLGRPEEALDALASGLVDSPGDADALALVQRILREAEDPSIRKRAAEQLEHAAEVAEDPELSASLLDALLTASAELPELHEARKGWFERRLEQPHLSPEAALEVALRAVAELPGDLALWERAEELGREAQGAPRVAESYKSAFASPSNALEGLDPDTIEELGRRAVEFYEEWFDEPDTVASMLRRTVDLVPASGWAFERLKLIYNQRERWDELFSLYDEAIARAPDRLTRRELLEDAALAARDLAIAPERAIRYYEELLALRDDARTRATLERLYERYGNHEKLIEVLERKLPENGKGSHDPHEEGDAAQRLRARIATLWIENVGKAEASLDVIERMLKAEPERDEGFELLERLLEATEDKDGQEASEPIRAARRRTAELLAERYRKEGRSESLARVLEIALDSAESKGDRAEQLQHLVRIRLEELGDERGAFEAIAKLVSLEPSVEEHRTELARLAERLSCFEEQAGVLTAAAGVSAPELKMELLAQAAAIYRDRSLGADKAIERYRAILAMGIDDAPLTLTAARELERLFAEAGRDAERCDILEKLAVIEPFPEERRAARAKLARLAWPSVGDLERAIRAYRASLAEDPSDTEAMSGLGHVLEENGRWSELIEVLEQRAAALEGTVARKDKAYIASIWDERLNDASRAIQTWTELRERFGDDDESADALAALFEKTGRWSELIELLEREAKAATSPERAAHLWSSSGKVYRDRLERYDEAIHAYEAALARRPEDSAARGGLKDILDRLYPANENERDGAAHAQLVSVVAALHRTYAQIGDQIGDQDGTIDLLEPRLAVAESDEQRVAILLETAKLLESHKGDAGQAFDALFRALNLAPGGSFAADVIRLADTAGRWDVIAEALATGLDNRPELPASLARDLFWKVAIWQRDQKGDAEAAEAALFCALSRSPEDTEILEALADLQRRAPSRALITTLLSLARAKDGAFERYAEAVEVAETHVGDPALAKSIAQEMLDAAGSRWSASGSTLHAGERFASAADAASWSIEALVRLSQDEGSERIAELYLRGAQLPFDVAERRRLRLKAAELSSVERAIAIYEELFEEDRNDPLASERLDALYRAHGRRAELIRLRERQIAATNMLDWRAVLRYDLAGLLVEEGDRARAIATLRENLFITPSHPPSIVRLTELLEESGHYRELVELCEDQAGEAETEGRSADAATMWTKAATLAESQLNDLNRAMFSHRRAVSLGSATSADALARLLIGRGEHAAAAEVLEKLCEKAEPGTLHLLVLRLCDAYLAAGQVSEAQNRLERFIPLATDAAPLRERLAALYRDAGAWGPLARLIAERAARAPDRATRAARLREAAHLHLHQCADPESAVPLLEQAVEIVPDDQALRRELASALSSIGKLNEAAAALRELIASYGSRRPKERALVHYELAQVYLASDNRPSALGELDAALRIDPAHPDILLALAKLALEEGQLDRAARTFRALLLIVRKPPKAPESATVSRAEVLFALHEVARRQDEDDRAAEYLESAFEAARESTTERERLLAAIRAQKRHDVLATALETQLTETPEGPETAAILDELAGLYDELGRPGDALDARLRALTMGPLTRSSLERALDLARRAGQIERYVGALAELEEREQDPALRTELYLVLASALEHDLKNDRGAAEALQKAESQLQASGNKARLEEVWRAQSSIYERLGDSAELEALLEKRIAASTGGDEANETGELADALYRLAELRLTRTESQSEGLSLLERAHAADPQPDRTEAALREALRVAPKSHDAARALEHLARETGRDRALVDAILHLWDAQRDEGAIVDPASGYEALREAAELARRLEDTALLEDILQRAIAESAATADAGLDWALIALAERRQAEEKLAEAADFKERAARVAPPGEDRALLLDVARLASTELDDLARASRIYEELREREPAEREIWQPLAEVYRKKGDRERLAALLEETTPLVDSVEERVQLRLERARMAMADDEAKAIELLQEILEEDPAQTEVASVLIELVEKSGNKDELIELYRKRLDAAKDREDIPRIVSLSLKLGALLEQEWDEQGAIDVYQAAIDWDGKSRDLLRAVVRLSSSHDDALALADAMERLLPVEEGEEAERLAIKLSQMRNAEGDEDGATRALEVGYTACPTSESLREELVQLYTTREDWHKLAELYVQEANALSSDEERIGKLCEAADILREQAGDAAGAAEVLRQAFEADVSDRDILLALIDAYSTIGEHERAIEAIAKALAQNPDDPWLYRSRASLHDALGRAELALLDLEEAYEKSGGAYASELVTQLEGAIAWCASEDAPDAQSSVRPLRLRLAEVLLKTGDVERARAELTELCRTDGRDKAALKALAALETSQEEWDAASAVYRRLLPLEEGEALIETTLNLADACEKAGRFEDARAGLERALRASPNDTLLRGRLREVYRASGANRELAAMLLEDATNAVDVPGRFALLLEAGRELLEADGEAARATSVLEEARSLMPEEPEATLLLADAYAAADRINEARALLDAATAAHKGRRSKALGAVYQRRSNVELAAGDRTAALAALTKAFECDIQNGPLAMELGLLAMELEDVDAATRALRAVTRMKISASGAGDGISAPSRALAYFHLGRMASEQGDRLKARLLIEKAVADDASLEPARMLLEQLRGG